MAIRHACGVIAAALLSGATVFAQSPSQTWTAITDQEETAITVVGCLQKESDYRRQHDTGEGGFLGMGGGLGDEYILVNAFRAGHAGAAASAAGCAAGAAGEAFELTGSREDDLAAFVGRRVEITGMLKEADREVGTSGTVRPEGGYDLLGRDLHLFEVEVTSFREAPVSVPIARAEPVAPPSAPEPAPLGSVRAPQLGQAPAVAPEPIELPKTAGPVPFIALLGLLSVAGGLGLGAFRR